MSIRIEDSQCIFCKTTTAKFNSVEHVVPESLGNTEHILPPGAVCDPCNNYFARKVEGRILSSECFRQARHRNAIPSKRNRIPVQEALSFPDGILFEMSFLPDGSRTISPENERSQSRLLRSDRLTAVFPVAAPPDQLLFSRFLLMMGLEALAERLLEIPYGIKVDHINNTLLDESREFARYGSGCKTWPYHTVCIYREGTKFYDVATRSSYDIPHEYMLLYTDEDELYFVIAIFGIQYSINLGGPETSGFQRWLTANNFASPLYLIA